MASPHLCHQSSLEQIIDFSIRPGLGEDQRASARRIFLLITAHFEATRQQTSNKDPSSYNRPALVRLTCQYARSAESQDNFLRAFFEFMEIPMDADQDLDGKLSEDQFRTRFYDFADYLVDNFFLPLKASSRKTPQPSPAVHSAIQRIQGAHDFIGTPDRLKALRGACLVRDHHRCVISRRFDQGEGELRYQKDDRQAKDDDGILLDADTMAFDSLEVAHILPHSLMKLNTTNELDPSRQAVLAILNMFDSRVSHIIEGTNIDQPQNALTLTPSLHVFFGNFQVFFEPVDGEGQPPHTYRIGTFTQPRTIRDPPLPIVRTLLLTSTRTIDPPSPRLLAIHSAIAHILHLSAAGAYIDRILRDLEENDVREDGSTALDRFVRLRLGGWLDGMVDADHRLVGW